MGGVQLLLLYFLLSTFSPLLSVRFANWCSPDRAQTAGCADRHDSEISCRNPIDRPTAGPRIVPFQSAPSVHRRTTLHLNRQLTPAQSPPQYRDAILMLRTIVVGQNDAVEDGQKGTGRS